MAILSVVNLQNIVYNVTCHLLNHQCHVGLKTLTCRIVYIQDIKCHIIVSRICVIPQASRILSQIKYVNVT